MTSDTIRWEDVPDGALVLCPDGAMCAKLGGRGTCVLDLNRRGDFCWNGAFYAPWSWAWESEDSYPEVRLIAVLGDLVESLPALQTAFSDWQRGSIDSK